MEGEITLHVYWCHRKRGEKRLNNDLGKIAKGLGISVNEIFNIPMDIKDPDRLKASMLKEIEKSDPEILKIALDLVKELNTLKTTQEFGKRSKRP